MTYALTKHREDFSKSTLGFWIYLMTDSVLFASLFAAYAVLRTGVADGPLASQIFDLDFVLLETIVLLASSFTCGLALVGLRLSARRLVALSLGLTFVLGAAFVALELYEFSKLIAEGDSWQTSAFLSSYFTLVATHGLHIVVGLMWIISLVIMLIQKGFSNTFAKRLTLFALFWHFLDVIWICIFTLVYLFGVAS